MDDDEPNYVTVYLRIVVDADDDDDARQFVLDQLVDFPGEVYVMNRVAG